MKIVLLLSTIVLLSCNHIDVKKLSPYQVIYVPINGKACSFKKVTDKNPYCKEYKDFELLLDEKGELVPGQDSWLLINERNLKEKFASMLEMMKDAVTKSLDAGSEPSYN